MSIVHLLNDDVFADSIIDIFENAFNGENVYLVVKDGHIESLDSKLIVQGKSYIRFIDTRNLDRNFFNTLEYKTELLIIHYLDYRKIAFLKRTGYKKYPFPVMWNVFGADFYNLIGTQKSIVLKETGDELQRLFYRMGVTGTAGRLKKRLKGKFELLRIRSLARNFRYLSSVIPYERDIILKELKIDLTYHWVSVGYLKTARRDINQRTGIVVGNSAAPANNHFEALRAIKETGYPGNILIPISYGGFPDFAARIKEEATRLFGERVRFSDSLMSEDEYFDIIGSYNCLIINSTRQLALGNIIFCLQNGLKVFLRDENPTYRFLLDNKIRVYSFKDELTAANISDKQGDQVSLRNRNGIEKLYSRDNVINRNRESLIAVMQKD